MSQHWRQPGEHVPVGFFGPDNPAETGTRWAQYPRGFALNDTTNNRLFSGAPPLNPFTNKPFLGAIIDQPRINNTSIVTGCVVQVDVGDPGGGRAFREFVVGPGSPVALALGQYSNANVNVVQRSAVDGVFMNQPVRIQWVDRLPALPDAGLLRSRQMDVTVAAGASHLVPDGAVRFVSQTAGAVTWRDNSSISDGGPDDFGQIVTGGQVVNCYGQTFGFSVDTPVRFLLAGL